MRRLKPIAKRQPGKIKLLEKEVSRQISDFMEYRGWRKFRNSVGMAMGFSGEPVTFGEKGMPDLRFVRYFKEPYGACVHLWVEVKAPNADLNCKCQLLSNSICRPCNQARWREKERMRNGIVWLVDNFDEFLQLYEERFAYLHDGQMPGQVRLF